MNKSHHSFVLLLIVCIFCFHGCATFTPQQKQTWNQTVPMCYRESDCEAKWSAARNWVQNNSGYKIQIYTTDLIETYNPSQSSPKIAVRITKQPLSTSMEGNKSYAIAIKVWCNNIFGCVPSTDDAIIGFNKYVNAAQAYDESCYKSALEEDRPKLGIYHVQYKNNKTIIKSVCNNSPAFNAGLKPNDIIVKVGSHSINDNKDLAPALKKLAFGDIVNIEVLRDNITQTCQVKLPTRDEVILLMASTKSKESVIKPTAEEKLESLQRMLKKGLITQEEYDSKRKKILSEL